MDESTRKEARKQGVAARNSLNELEKENYSAKICDTVRTLPEYRNAETILMYKWTQSEVRLNRLEEYAAADGKTLVYPLCVSDTEMVAVEPGAGAAAWKTGAFGITEPVVSKGTIIGPKEIDLALCPCSAFDEECSRMGMGAGYYDRYLAKCSSATFASVAYEAQKSDNLPVNDYDVRMNMVITESAVYRA